MSKSSPFEPTIHTLQMRACMTYVCAALQSDSDGDTVQYYLAYAAHAAKQADSASYTKAEQVAAQYMTNFVADVRTAIRRGGLADQLDSGLVEKN